MQRVIYLFGLITTLLPALALAIPTEWQQVGAGSIFLSDEGGQTFVAPLVETDVYIDITGLIARVKLRQRFSNPARSWAEAVYVFPLPEESAVDHLRLQVGERVIEGEIHEKEKARKIYDKAKVEGKRASLLEQQRPNLFTTRLANIAPGESLVVEIEYQQTVQRQGQSYSLRFPMTVTPRYAPGRPMGDEFERPALGVEALAAAAKLANDESRVTAPLGSAVLDHHPVHIDVDLQAGFEVEGLVSLDHPVSNTVVASGHYQLRLAADQHRANADFRLQWRATASDQPQATFYTETWAGQQYGLLLLAPPEMGLEVASLPREVIFIIDTSGSMGGEPLRQAKAALQAAIGRLKEQDSFNIIEFNSLHKRLWDTPRFANDQNRAIADSFVRGLHSRGGTEMAAPLRDALCGDCGRPSTVRQLIFITDGAVANEQQLFALIRDRIGGSRLFTVGIGAAPNSYFMRKAAHAGRGTFHYINSTNKVSDSLGAFFEKLENPVLSDIAVNLDGQPASRLAPANIPDLYQGEPLMVTMKLDRSPQALTISGQLAATAVEAVVPLNGTDRAGIHALWARQQLGQLYDDYGFSSDQAIKSTKRAAMIQLALHHHLVSPFTSLVAVDKTPARTPGDGLDTAHLPLNPPRGTRFGLASTATPGPLLLRLGVLALLIAAGLGAFIVRQGRGQWQKC